MHDAPYIHVRHEHVTLCATSTSAKKLKKKLYPTAGQSEPCKHIYFSTQTQRAHISTCTGHTILFDNPQYCKFLQCRVTPCSLSLSLQSRQSSGSFGSLSLQHRFSGGTPETTGSRQQCTSPELVLAVSQEVQQLALACYLTLKL